MTKLVIYGLGDFAKAMRFYFERDTEYRVEAYCADRLRVTTDVFDGLPIVAFEDVHNVYPRGSCTMFVAVGYANMRARKVMYAKALNRDYAFASYISPFANVDVTTILGVNNVVLQGTQIEPFCTIGSNNIIWASVNICHNATIGDHCFLASQSLVGGCATVGDSCFVGFDSTVLQHVTLAEETLVGAKSLIVKSTMACSKHVGIPARCVSVHAEEGIMLE